MPKLIIDDITVEVAEGTSVLEAAHSVDIPVPYFCWHPALGKAGACRVCAVKILEGPVKGIQMSCMLPAQDGMVVSTTDPEAVAMRRHVIEWLMINHPHDCPVCDEGGECQLQDLTIAGGHGIRRYSGKKRTHINQYLGANIEHEMNRCIQCYRCVRFYQEYAGGSDFGVMGSAGRVYFGRFKDGELESPFSGNLVDICPTGVFTDKAARFRARYWDYEMAPSICIGCSMGCNITPVARYRELLKIVARRNDVVNGYFICDKGRFSDSGVNDPQRPRTSLVDGRETSLEEALEAVLIRVGEMQELYGAGTVAVVGSSRLSLEAAVLLPLLVQTLSVGKLSFFNKQNEHQNSVAQVGLLTKDISASQQDIRNSDCIIIYTCDPLHEAPMMALAVRQAWRNGATIYLVGDEVKLPFEITSVATLDDLPLINANRPVLLCNSGSSVDKIKVILKEYKQMKLATMFPAVNSYGVALLSQKYAAATLEEILAEGKIKGIIAIEADIPVEMLEGISFLVALDWRYTAAIKGAEIIIPTTAWVEMDGTYINNEGRAQHFKKVMNPGVPIRGLDLAYHPPHIHRTTPPGGTVQPAWQTVARLIEMLGGEPIIEPFAGKWEYLRRVEAESLGVMIDDL